MLRSMKQDWKRRQRGGGSLLERLRINSQSSDHLELATKELWRVAACFQGAMSLTSSAYFQMFVELVHG